VTLGRSERFSNKVWVYQFVTLDQKDFDEGPLWWSSTLTKVCPTIKIRKKLPKRIQNQ